MSSCMQYKLSVVTNKSKNNIFKSIVLFGLDFMVIWQLLVNSFQSKM